MKALFTYAVTIFLMHRGFLHRSSRCPKASEARAGGMYAEAADMFLPTLCCNGNNIDAKIGLEKTGQMVLNDKLSVFFKAFGVGDDKEAAVNAYLDAKDYQDRRIRRSVGWVKRLYRRHRRLRAPVKSQLFRDSRESWAGIKRSPPRGSGYR